MTLAIPCAPGVDPIVCRADTEESNNITVRKSTRSSGSTFVVYVWSYISSTHTVTDAYGNTYTQVPLNTSGNPYLYAFYCIGGTGGDDHWFLATGDSPSCVVVEIYGVTSLFDHKESTGLSAVPYESPNLALNANDVLLQFGIAKSRGSPDFEAQDLMLPTVGTWLAQGLRNTGHGNPWCVGGGVAPVAGNYQASFTNTGGAYPSGVASIMAFRP